MRSHARAIFRKLRGNGSRGSEPAPSAPATTAEGGLVRLSPRAIHVSDLKRSPTDLKRPHRPGFDEQFITTVVVNARGAADYSKFYNLLLREKRYGEYDPTGNFETDYHCDGYIYNVSFIPAGALAASVIYPCYMQHVCLVLTYDASSRESWDETAAVCERMRGRCNDGVLPFFATMTAAAVGEGIGIGEGAGEPPGAPRVETEAFATQRGFLFVEFSPTTGRGICDAVGSLVELAHSVRDQYTMKKEGEAQRFKRAQEIKTVSSS
ncbi:hypothetical protein BJX65DRAFT_298159 [Aspergillus insuetus]